VSRASWSGVATGSGVGLVLIDASAGAFGVFCFFPLREGWFLEPPLGRHCNNAEVVQRGVWLDGV